MPRIIAALALELRKGEEHIPDMLVEHLLQVGYTRVDVVEMPGQVTVRGGILDVYSPEMDRPVRVDFFGDEIESIRKFDPDTQRSLGATGGGTRQRAAAAADRDPGDGEAADRDQRAADADRHGGGCRSWTAAKHQRSCRRTSQGAPAAQRSFRGGSFMRPWRVRRQACWS